MNPCSMGSVISLHALVDHLHMRLLISLCAAYRYTYMGVNFRQMLNQLNAHTSQNQTSFKAPA